MFEKRESCLEYAEQCADAGVNGYIRKPFKLEDLMRRVTFLVESKEEVKSEVESLTDDAHPKLREVVKYIHENFSRSINIEDLSRSHGISSGYLARLFKENAGKSLVRYINKLGVIKAKNLLEDTDLTTAEIMDKVGFSTDQHFFKQFKRYTGYTPKLVENNP